MPGLIIQDGGDHQVGLQGLARIFEGAGQAVFAILQLLADGQKLEFLAG